MQSVPLIRIFLSSPGDVNQERKIVLDAIEMLPHYPMFRGKLAIEVIAWDKPGAGTVMRANLTPQEAINRGLPKPSDCDLVIVIFWSRVGTPFEMDGQSFLSGTHWELMDALESDKTEAIIYRRMENKLFDIDDTVGQDQYRRVRDFFNSEMFYKGDAIRRGVNQYDTLDAFRSNFSINLQELILEQLAKHSETTFRAEDKDETVVTISQWESSPFPGLRAFTEADAPIFFGREQETDGLIKHLENSRLVAVVGASGSGKSSLVRAGLLPNLRANAILGSKDWRFVTFIPTDKPYEALAEALIKNIEELSVNNPQQFLESLATKSDQVVEILSPILKEQSDWSECLLVIDQFEELFTLASEADAQSFVKMLTEIAISDCVRAVVTMRHDFYHRAIEIPQLARLLRNGSFPLATPTSFMLYKMIEKPASVAGLLIEDGLIERLIEDIGDEPGNLALLAYTLDELYKLSENKVLTHEKYDRLGGAQGAIGTRAEETFKQLTDSDDVKEAWLQRVFHELVAVDDRGIATRQHAKLARIADEDLPFIDAFVNARLLLKDREHVEVAHEAIFKNWERLKNWVMEFQEDLILLRQVRNAAIVWDNSVPTRPDYLLWQQERLQMVYNMRERLHPDFSKIEKDFIEPEQKRLYQQLGNVTTTHQQRFDISKRLANIGDNRRGIGLLDNGLPEIEWLPIHYGGQITIEDNTFTVEPFFIAKYLTTYIQYQAFVDSSEYDEILWWDKFPSSVRPQPDWGATNGNQNAPADTVSWYHCVAFSKWMNAKFHGLEIMHPSGEIFKVGDTAEIRLPTEWEWQWVAQNGDQRRLYPWGEWDELPRANTDRAKINHQSMAVGMYPHGAAVSGAMDMSGNLWEWCLNDYEGGLKSDGSSNGADKVLRGGSFLYRAREASCTYRLAYSPDYVDYHFGVRLVLSYVVQ